MRVEGLAGRFAVREERIGALTFELTLLADFEAEVDAVWADVEARGGDYAELEAATPMFGALWPPARALAERVEGLGDLGGARILELGCGLALPSLVAARRGARVVATDGDPRAERLLAVNVARNGIEGLVYATHDWSAPGTDVVTEGGFDRVVASDVLYDTTMPDRVAGAFERFLAPNGVGWLTDPGRRWLDAFPAACRQRGLRVDTDVRGDGRHAAFVLEVRR